ncbi:DNA-binding response OmpR family regulator [Sediminitomix flava]|uniref:DNA-binding response OmpR family regulator n=2 Tax=Sediminitomix flava TaxID=379075 RepID=A0A315ZI00_SEDFL|nr:DNA-binding response OmpR family regulator [Sediminitomix flava]
MVVEDDPFLGLLVKELFENRGYEATLFKDGERAFKGFCEIQPDLCVLDVMLPIKDGFSLAEEIRTTDSNVPIVFLTAKSMTEDVVKGFQIGANDYVKKPFSMEELLVRVESILKREKGIGKLESSEVSYQFGIIDFNYTYQQISVGDMHKSLTSREADLLKILCEQRNQLVNRKLILVKLWGDDSFFNGRSLDVFITKLRKLLKAEERLQIQTVRGEGYRLVFAD